MSYRCGPGKPKFLIHYPCQSGSYRDSEIKDWVTLFCQILLKKQ